ncbi:MAG: DUF1549 domain-containing protein [Maribacter sp.]|nr:DUF1549 domain-containing protein [Maribacter sp.]
MEDFRWIFQFLGRLHPLIVHFPIGLLVVGLILELVTIGQKRQGLRQGINWMVYIGAISAVIGAIFGWLLRTNDDYLGELVDLHQNMGITTGALAGITAFLLMRKMKNKASSYIPYRIGLTLTVVCLIIAGHLGTNLTHGEDFLSSVLPGNTHSPDDGKAALLFAELNQLDSLTTSRKDQLNLEVRKIFAHNCYQCHSENKKKGELVLENKAGVYKGGKGGPIIVFGKPAQSELYRRIALSPNHEDVMPKKGKVLKNSEIALIRLWIESGAHWSDQTLKLFPEAPLALSKPDLPVNSTEKHPVDRLINSYFERNAIEWPEVVDDKTFIRRVYLDIIGLLPEPKDIDQFVVDPDPDKRSNLIDTLLGDSTNYTEHWLSFWNDLLRNDYTGTGFITGGRKQITDWLYTSLKENKPYNLMVKELVNPTEDSEGFIKGIEWRGVVNSSQRTEMQAAQNIGQSLLGINVKCASCHNSFVSNLTLEQSYGFASIFADSVLELNRCDKPMGKMAEVNFLYPELGNIAAKNKKERLSNLSEVMVKPENGRLYRTITNRFWQRLMGRGIVEPVDEMDNATWDGVLLDWLAADFLDSGYDLKHLLKMIMTSKGYQLPSVSYHDVAEIKNNFIFHGPTLRRMSAEEFSDAVSQVITPMYAAVAYSPTGELPASRIWHRELKFERDVLPEPGKRYFRRTFSLANRPIQSATVLISVDHSYILYINGKNIAQGADWKKVDKLEVSKYLSAGKNCIAIEGFNEGSIANPAGISFAMKIEYDNENDIIINADTNWKSTAVEPHKGWVGIGFNDGDWAKVRDYGTSNWGNLVNFSFDGPAGKFARASLVSQHPFMKALGRPSRENVTTTRDDQATLLQALELTNGAFFNQVLAEGADAWLVHYGANGQRIIEALYQRSLGRNPTKSEREIMLGVLGGQPNREALQDVFWATLNLPEFQFIN